MDARHLVALAAALLLLAGCTANPDLSRSDQRQPAASGVASEQPHTDPPASLATPSTLPVLAARETSATGTALTVAVNSLSTTASSSTLNFTVTNRGREQWRPGTAFASSGHYDNVFVSGVYLIDTANGRRYLPALDSEGECVCSPTHTPIGVGQSITYSAVFAALPDNVATASVSIPLAGVFDGVPVTR